MSPLLHIAMIRFRAAAALALFALAAAATLTAQPGDDLGTLYFPPTLSVSQQFGTADPVLGITESITPTSAVLLPILFFDHPGDWTIPERYQVFNGSFAADDYADTLAVHDWNPTAKYYELLNIIGYRMRENPGTTIHLLAGYSTDPGEGQEVADARSEVVREYLTNVWHIAPQRIGTLPSRRMCDSSDHALRRQEARQVMIVTNDWELLKPVRYAIAVRSVSSLYMRFMIDPRIDPQQVEEITIVMTGGDRIIGQATVPGHSDSLTYQIRGMWWVSQPNATKDIDFSSIAVDAYVRLRDGRVHRSNTEKIAVQENRYESGGVESMPNSLVLPFFSYRDSALNGYHRLLIERFMQDRPSGLPVAMDLMGRADLSEDPGFDDADVADYTGPDPFGYAYTPAEDDDQPGQLYIWSDVPRDAAVIDSREIALEESGYEEEAAADSVEEIRENRFTSDSLAVARTRVVERYFRDSLKISVSMFDELPDRERGVATTFEYYPEERWLARSVILVVYPHERFLQQKEWLEESMKERQREYDR